TVAGGLDAKPKAGQPCVLKTERPSESAPTRARAELGNGKKSESGKSRKRFHSAPASHLSYRYHDRKSGDKAVAKSVCVESKQMRLCRSPQSEITWAKMLHGRGTTSNSDSGLPSKPNEKSAHVELLTENKDKDGSIKEDHKREFDSGSQSCRPSDEGLNIQEESLPTGCQEVSERYTKSFKQPKPVLHLPLSRKYR
ncbi:hypothetical protein ElyMa_003106500, partial [Elysia marginata]